MRTRRARRDASAAVLAVGVVLACGAALLAPEVAATEDATRRVSTTAPTDRPSAERTHAPAWAPRQWRLPGDSTPTVVIETPPPSSSPPLPDAPAAPAVPPVPTPAGPTAPGPARTVYLTFDDGPSPRWTRKVLRVLDRHDARATFFFLGANARAYPALARAVADAGHGVGNHSYRHRDLRRLRKRQVRDDLRRSQRAIRRATGVTPSCLRPPYGSTDRDVRAQARRLGLRTQLWDVDPRDWDRRPAGRISRSTLRHVRDGSVVLLHDSGGDRRRTLRALPRILSELGARGFRFSGLCR